MSAIFSSTGAQRTLDRATERPEPVTDATVQDPTTLARIVRALLEQVGALRRRFQPSHIDFEDVVVDATGTTGFRFEHRFGGRARYWPVEWSGDAAPNLRKDAASTDDVLVLTSTSAGTVTLRIEEAG